MKKKFLTAEWRKLILVNYAVNPNILRSYLPQHTELDLWNNTCYVSLVGFMFLNTRVKGCKLPGHINFEEVNLRFYVKHSENGEVRRGVAFIKEIVPKRMITSVANLVYKEPYQTCVMDHSWKEENDNLFINYRWKNKGKWNDMRVTSSTVPFQFAPGSEADFITEHYWGYTRVNEHQTNEYEVAHPSWEIYPVTQSEINVDFGSNYGKEFAILNNQQPVSVMLAEGSEISVGSKRSL